jgi:hypothetical protein
MMGLMFMGPLLLVGLLVAFVLAGVILASSTETLRRLLQGLSLERDSRATEPQGQPPAEGGAGPMWPNQERLCPACKEPFERGWRLCPHCGQPLV